MLNPDSRQIYLEHLRPPCGYKLERAVATTYSLDLLSLLMVPMSMVLNECQDRKELLKDPVAVLEALRSTAGRFAVFCQQGRISVPKNVTQLYGYLEKVVVEVRSPDENGVFHPKTWLLRFVGEDPGRPVVYRFLCLSRNLTFDKSWDTILTLEGELATERKNAFAINRPLNQFLLSLPSLSPRRPESFVSDHIDLMANEALRVRFAPPEGFEEFKFIPSGIPGRKYALKNQLPSRTRMLALSPFLSDKALVDVLGSGSDNLLISRNETLESLSQTAYKNLKKGTEFFLMDEAAETAGPEDTDSESEEFESEQTLLEDFSGLHAKLLIMEKGWKATIWTGSANLTNAVFQGRNVEFTVELKGPKAKFGIDNFLGDENDKHAFQKLLLPYERDLGASDADKTAEKLEKMLEQARNAVISSGPYAEVTKADRYCLKLKCKEPMFLKNALPGNVIVNCRPISLKKVNDADFAALAKENEILFDDLAIHSLTSFFAFMATARLEGESAGISFVLNLPLHNLPADRDRMILRSIIENSDLFVRYLMLILSPDETKAAGMKALVESTSESDLKSGGGIGKTPLFEEMLRAMSRSPGKIDRIARLMEDLADTENFSEIVPEGFSDIWEMVVKVHEEMKPEENPCR